MAKSTSIFKENTRLPLKKKSKKVENVKKTTVQFLQISILTDMKSMKKSKFRKTTQNGSICDQINIRVQLQTF